ncbi:MAG: cupin domain-containing protein [Planctomycetaceae bacterium]
MVANFFDNIPDSLPEELVTILLKSPGCRIERILSHGQSSPEGFWYDQDETEWVVVLKGSARLQFSDGTIVKLNPGDHVCIGPHERHRVDWTTSDEVTVWLAVFVSCDQPDESE